MEQILAIWLRRGKPIHRFNGDFERLISRKIPQNLTKKFNISFSDFALESDWLSGTDSYDDDPEQDIELAVRFEEDLEETVTIAGENINQDITEMTRDDETSLQLTASLPDTVKNDNTNLYSPLDWSRPDGNKEPIHQFTPPLDDSDFYQKLKKVVEQKGVDSLDN